MEWVGDLAVGVSQSSEHGDLAHAFGNCIERGGAKGCLDGGAIGSICFHGDSALMWRNFLECVPSPLRMSLEGRNADGRHRPLDENRAALVPCVLRSTPMRNSFMDQERWLTTFMPVPAKATS